jgi:hypothetical protein
MTRWVIASLLLVTPLHAADDNEGWSKPVDGIACRLRIDSEVVPGQAIPATIEIKNVSDKPRYLVPMLDPYERDILRMEIKGPNGQSLKLRSWGRAVALGPESFQIIAPRKVIANQILDLRDHFPELQSIEIKGRDVHFLNWPADSPRWGQYQVALRFRSPKVPSEFVVGKEGGGAKLEKIFEYPSAELLAGQWANEVVAPTATFTLRPLAKDDLAVHEWGVFTVFSDAKYANVNRQEEWGALPSFFYRQFPKERLRWSPSAWDKPIVYFYAKPKHLTLGVEVRFPEGAPVVWWPAAARPLDESPGPQRDKDRPFRFLQWEVSAGEEVPASRFSREGGTGWIKATEFPLPEDCWLRKCRLKDATLLTVWGSHEGRGKPWISARPETERFLYYDGLVPAPSYLRCEKVEAKSLTLRNKADFDLGPVFVVDRRNLDADTGARFQILDAKEPFKAGSTRTIEPPAVAKKDWPKMGVAKLREALLDAGLFAPEADSLLELWRKQLFESDGVTVFHLLPRKEYDRMLPLEIVPAPAGGPVRVGIALHPRIEVEPGFAARVKELLPKLDDMDFSVREEASKELLAIGPVAVQLLREERDRTTSPEVKRRINDVLAKVDAAEWLHVVPKEQPKK